MFSRDLADALAYYFQGLKKSDINLSRFHSCGKLSKHEHTLTTESEELEYYYCQSCNELFTP